MRDLDIDYKDSAWVASKLHLDISTVEALMEAGELPGFRIGHKWLVSPERISRFLKEEERRQSESRPARPTGPGSIRHRTQRRRASKNLSYRLLGQSIVGASAKDMLVQVLRKLAERDGTFLSRFSREGGRKRRYVASNPADLYPGQPHLVSTAKELLSPGWWVGTNYNLEEIEKIVRKACEVAGLKWGEDIAVERFDEDERVRRALLFVGIAADPDPDASLRHDELFVEAALNERQ